MISAPFFFFRFYVIELYINFEVYIYGVYNYFFFSFSYYLRAEGPVRDEKLRPVPHLVALQPRNSEVQEQTSRHRERDLKKNIKP